MGYRDPLMQRTILKAKARAQSRLQQAHNDEYHGYYLDEMFRLGYVRVPRGKSGGWKPADDPAAHGRLF
jgi:hypothetical protein